MWCGNMMERAIQLYKDEIMPFAATWIDREGSMPSEASQMRKRNASLSVWNLKYDRNECVYKQE